MLRRLAVSSSSFKTTLGRQASLASTRAFASAYPLASFASGNAKDDRHRQAGLMAAAGLMAGAAFINSQQEKTKCCGIAGVVGTPDNDAR